MKTMTIALACSLMTLAAAGQNARKYIVHSSKNVLGCTSDHRAVLVGAVTSSARPFRLARYGAGEDASRNCHRNMGIRHIGSCPPPSVATDTCGSQRSLIARWDRSAQGTHYCRQQHLLATRHTPASHPAWYQHHQARRRPYGEGM